MTGPQLPYRVDLATFLASEGRETEADRDYRCGCGQVRHASLFKDVRDQPDAFSGQPFVCEVCVSDLERRELVAHEAAFRDWLASQGRLDDETLNACRARRDRALGKSDWIEFPSSQQRIGADLTAAWLTYRAAIWAWFYAARDNGLIGDFPLSPDERPATPPRRPEHG